MSSNVIDGDQLHQQKARLVLPILVRQAKMKQPIFYGELANEVGMPNPRNLRFPLGVIGNAIQTLEKKTKTKIPYIQSLVINKSQQCPGHGIAAFIEGYNELSKIEKQEKVQVIWKQVYDFPQWDWVLTQFGLSPIVN